VLRARDRIGSGLVAFRNPGFPQYWAAHLGSGFATQIQTVAIGWQVYDLTRNPLDLGLIGLSQFMPALLLVLVTGAVADRFPRRLIMGASLLVMATASGGLFYLTVQGLTHVGPVFALLALFGTARAFYNPARQSIVPNLVPANHLSNAIAINSSSQQISTICGPVAGGLLFALNPLAAYGTALGLFAGAAVLVALMPPPSQSVSKGVPNWETLSAGVRYIWSEKIVLGAISLDLFVVILGGVVALLPVFAADVLDIGPVGLGWLRSAQGIGAISVALFLMVNPIRDHAGKIMFTAVAAFGAFTVVFALSETVWLSVLALMVIGGADMVSVFVRATLIQLWTPDDLRGRVNAVNQVFIGASNEVGGFRAGSTAALIGPVAAVLVGGIGTLAVVAIWMRKFPDLARIRRLDGT
jgi:MFS family permease